MSKRIDLKGIGDRLRAAREDAGLSQAQVAKMLGLHRPSISEIENESRKVSVGEIREFARIYRVSLDWLIGAEGGANEQLKLAARKLEELQEKDLETVMRIIDSFRRDGDKG